MEGYDVLTDSYSAEVISLMLLERVWSRIRGYLDEKAATKKERTLSKRLSDMEKSIAVNTAIDKRRDREK